MLFRSPATVPSLSRAGKSPGTIRDGRSDCREDARTKRRPRRSARRADPTRGTERMIWQHGRVTSEKDENNGKLKRQPSDAVKIRHFCPLLSIFPADGPSNGATSRTTFFFRTVGWCDYYSYHFGRYERGAKSRGIWCLFCFARKDMVPKRCRSKRMLFDVCKGLCREMNKAIAGVCSVRNCRFT